MTFMDIFSDYHFEIGSITEELSACSVVRPKYTPLFNRTVTIQKLKTVTYYLRHVSPKGTCNELEGSYLDKEAAVKAAKTFHPVGDPVIVDTCS